MTGPADSSLPRPPWGLPAGRPHLPEGSPAGKAPSPSLPRPQPLPTRPGSELPADRGFGGPPPWEKSRPVEQAAAAAFGIPPPAPQPPLPRSLEELRLPSIHTAEAAKRIYLGLNADFLGANFRYSPDEVLAFLIERLEELKNDDMYAADPDAREGIERLIRSYRNSLLTMSWARRMAQVAETGTAAEYIAAKGEIKDAILAILQQERELSIASGYITVGGGHRLALFFKLDPSGQVSGEAVHKGAGLETYHPDWEFAAGQAYTDPWIKLNPVSVDRLETSPFLDMLIDLWVPRMGPQSTEYGPKDLFEGLLPEWPAGLTQRADKVLAKPHRAGTCAIKPYMAELFDVLSSDVGRLLKLDLTCTSIERYLDEAAPLDAAAAEVLDAVLAKLMRRLSKRQQAHSLPQGHPLIARVLQVYQRGQEQIQAVRRQVLEAVQSHRMDLEPPRDHGQQRVVLGQPFSLQPQKSDAAAQKVREQLEEFRSKDTPAARKIAILRGWIAQAGPGSPDKLLQAMGRSYLADFMRQLPLDGEDISVQSLLELVREALLQGRMAQEPFDVNQDMFVAMKLMALAMRQAQAQGLPLKSRLLDPILSVMLKAAAGLRPTSPQEARQVREMISNFRGMLLEPMSEADLRLPLPYARTFREQDLVGDPLLQWMKSVVDQHPEVKRRLCGRIPLAALVFLRDGSRDFRDPFLAPLAAFTAGIGDLDNAFPPAFTCLRNCVDQVIWEAGGRLGGLEPFTAWVLDYQQQAGNSWATLKMRDSLFEPIHPAGLLHSFHRDADISSWTSRLICEPPVSQNDLLSLKDWQQRQEVQTVVSTESIHAMQAPLVTPQMGVSLWMDFVESHVDRLDQPLFQEKLSSGLFSCVDSPEGPLVILEAALQRAAAEAHPRARNSTWETLSQFLIRMVEKTQNSKNPEIHNRLLRVLVQSCGFAALAGHDLAPATQFLHRHIQDLFSHCQQHAADQPAAVSAILTHLIALSQHLEWSPSLQGVAPEAAKILSENRTLQLDMQTPFRAVATEAAMAWSLFEANETVVSVLPRAIRSHFLFPYRNIRDVRQVEEGWTFLNDFGHRVVVTRPTATSYSLAREMEWLDGTKARYSLAVSDWPELPKAGAALVNRPFAGKAWVRTDGSDTYTIHQTVDESRTLSFHAGGSLFSADPHHLQLAVESYRDPSPLLQRLFRLSSPEATLVWKDSSGMIVRIEMPDLHLFFVRGQEQGRTVWSSPSYPGYQIDPEDQHPWLEPFARYLKLKARDGKSLVLIPDQRIERSGDDWLAGQMRSATAVPLLQSAPAPRTQPIQRTRLLCYRALPSGELQASGAHLFYDTLFLCLLCIERQDFRSAFVLIRELERRQATPDEASLSLLLSYCVSFQGASRPETSALLAHLLYLVDRGNLTAGLMDRWFPNKRVAEEYFQNWTNLREFALPLEGEQWLASFLKGAKRSSLQGTGSSGGSSGGWLEGGFGQWPAQLKIKSSLPTFADLMRARPLLSAIHMPLELLSPFGEPEPLANQAIPEQSLAVNFPPYLRILHETNRLLKEEASEGRDEKLQRLLVQRDQIAHMLRVACSAPHFTKAESREWVWLLAYLVAPELSNLHLPSPEELPWTTDPGSAPGSATKSAEERARLLIEALEKPSGPGRAAVEAKIKQWLEERSFKARFQPSQERPSPELPVPDIASRFALDALELPAEPLPPAALPADLLQGGLVRLEDRGCQLAKSFDALDAIYRPPGSPDSPCTRRILQQNLDDLGCLKKTQPPLRTITRDRAQLEAKLLEFQRGCQQRADLAQGRIAELMAVSEADLLQRLRQQGRILPQLTLQETLVALATDNLSLLYAANPSTEPQLYQWLLDLRGSAADYLDATAQSQQALRGLQQLRQLEQLQEARLLQNLDRLQALEALRAGLAPDAAAPLPLSSETLKTNTAATRAAELARLEAELMEARPDDAEILALEHRLAATLTAPRCYDDTSDLLLPLFEVLQNIRVTPEQAAAYRDLTRAGDASNFNLKAPTGFGKSSVLLGLWLLKTRRSHPLTLLAVPSSLLNSTVENLHQTLGRAFEASLMVLDLSREQLQRKEFLVALLDSLERAETEQRIVVMPIGSLHALANLQIKESLFKGDQEPAKILRSILDLLKTKTSLFIDESRECLSIHQRYDYAVGARHLLSTELSREIQDLYQRVVLLPNVLERFEFEFLPSDTSSSGRVAVTTENYASELLPLLARNAAADLIQQQESQRGDVPNLHRQQTLIEKDLRNQATPDEQLQIHELMHQLELDASYGRLKRQLNITLRASLPLKTGERYTCSDRIPSRVAVPVTDGVENPRAEFATKEESADLTLQANLKLPLPMGTVQDYLHDLHHHWLRDGVNFRRTPQGQDFLAMAGEAGLPEDPGRLEEKEVSALADFLNRPANLLHKAAVIGTVVLPRVAYYPNKISSSGMQIALATQQIRGASGTPDFDTTHPRLVPLNPQTPVLGNLLSLVEHSQNRLFPVQGATPQQLLRDVLVKDVDARLLIDVGNLFRHLSQHEAASIVLETLPAVQGVLYFDEEGKEQILCRPDQDAAGIGTHQLFHFLRRSKVVGTQLDRLSPSARALTTISCDTPQELFVQGIGRLRNLRRGNQGAQTTGIVWTHQDEQLMRQRLERAGSPAEGALSLQDLLRHLAFVQGETQAKENVFALMVYLDALVFQQLQAAGFRSEDFEMLREFLVTDTQQDDETLALEKTQERPIAEVVERLIQLYRDKITQASSSLQPGQVQRLQTVFGEQVFPEFWKFVDYQRLPAHVALADVSDERCLVQTDLAAEALVGATAETAGGATVSAQVELAQQIASTVSVEAEATRLQNLHQELHRELLQFTPASPLPSGNYWDLPLSEDNGLLGIEILEAPNTRHLSTNPKANRTFLKPIHHLLLVYNTESKQFSLIPLGFEDAAAYVQQLEQSPHVVPHQEFFLVANLPSGLHLLHARGDSKRLDSQNLNLNLIELICRVQRGLPLLAKHEAELRKFFSVHPEKEERWKSFVSKYREGLIL